MTLLRAILWTFAGALADLGDTLLVWAGVKYRPATGRARWQSDRPKPDPRASAWQRYLKEMTVTKHPKKIPPQDAKQPARPEPRINLSMTSDRPCMAESGLMIHIGTTVTYVCHCSGQAVRVKMEDGSEEVVHPHCFPELR